MGADHQLPPLTDGQQQLLDFALRGLRDASELVGGIGRTGRLNGQARDLVAKALADYGGPCPEAYADVLKGYISAPPGGRDALFLAVAYQAVDLSPPSLLQSPSPGSPDTGEGALHPGSGQAELLAWARLTLGLLSRLTQQERS